MSDTEIFRFMFVRPAKLKDGKKLEKESVKQTTSPSKLHQDLVKLKDKGELEKLLKKAKDEYDAATVFNTIPDFQTEYSEEEDFLKWVIQEIEDNSISVNRVKNELSKRNIDFSNISLLWDNLTIHTLLANPIGIIDLIVGLIRLDTLLSRIKSEDVTNRREIVTVMQSNVILPQDLFPVIFIEKTENENDVSDEEVEDNQDEIIQEVERLDFAKNELRNVLTTKLNSIKNKPISLVDFKNQHSLSIDKLEERSKKESTEKTAEQDYEKYLAQRNATRLSENDLKKLDKSTNQVLASLPFAKAQEQEISDIVNLIDEKKSVLIGQINSGVGYTMSYIDNLVEIIYPLNSNAKCLSKDTGESYCQLLRRLKSEDPNTPIVNVLGIGDYKVIRQKLLKYEAGEIAHIKNVFAGEEYTRSHRDLKRTEEIYESETERETEEKNEISTSDRFEMSKEISDQVEKSSQKELGVSLTAGYGPVSVSANASFSSSASSSSSSKSASKYARETTEKASNRVREKVREKRSKTTINEVEIINGYKLINDSPDHKVGKYLWVDKYYENQIYNIGKRLMLEFYIPSPLAFYIFSRQGASSKGVSVPNPIHPKDNKNVFAGKALQSYKDISRDNVDKWLTAYNVVDIPITPSEYRNIQTSFNKSLKFNATEKGTASFSEQIDIPSKYVAKKLTLRAAIHLWEASDTGWVIQVNNDSPYSIYGDWNNGNPMITHLPDIQEKISLSGIGRSDIAVYVNIMCELSSEGYEEWQISVYNSIMEAYENMKSEYESQLAAAQIQAGIQIEGNNPEINRQIEKEELQKWCTEALLLDRFESWNAMKKATNGRTEIDFNQLKKETPIVSFMNTAFEWGNITYKPYPYFYGNKAEHPTIRELSDTDPKFMAMLRAGYCRVIVPVSYGFETAVLHLINTGQVWLGGDLPVLGDPLFQSIVDEIKGEEYDSIGTPEGDPWETKVPTNLVWLNNNQPDGQL